MLTVRPISVGVKQQAPRARKGVRKIGKRLAAVNEAFAKLPKAARHGEVGVAVYKALGLMAGLKAEVLEKHAAVALALIGGA
jgi:hypothetical protein